MTTLAWILSALLALAFIGAGSARLGQARHPAEKLLQNPRMVWATDFSNPQVKTIGAFEVLGGLGVLQPRLAGGLEALAPVAAAGLAAVMIGALLTHGRRGELAQTLPVNSVLPGLAGAVAVIGFARA